MMVTRSSLSYAPVALRALSRRLARELTDLERFGQWFQAPKQDAQSLEADGGDVDSLSDVDIAADTGPELEAAVEPLPDSESAIDSLPVPPEGDSGALQAPSPDSQLMVSLLVSSEVAVPVLPTDQTPVPVVIIEDAQSVSGSIALESSGFSGVSVDQIHAIRVERLAVYDGFFYQSTHTVLLLFSDGFMYRGLTAPPALFDRAAAFISEPESWHNWRVDDDGNYQYKALTDDQWMSFNDTDLQAAEQSDLLDLSETVQFRQVKVSGSPLMGLVRTERYTVSLLPDNRYALSHGALTVGQAWDGRLAVTGDGASVDGQTSATYASMDGGLVSSTSKKSAEAVKNSLAGRYEIEGHQLTLFADDGGVSRQLFLDTSQGILLGSRFLRQTIQS